MPILNIDTSISKASFCISDKDNIWVYRENRTGSKQTAWLHEAIRKACYEMNFELSSIDAIAVSNGPGSYTGLRIGLATAKGICYALNLPLICIGTLEIMANVAMPRAKNLICPMIDARRMEVFAAIYNKDASVYKSPFAEVLTQKSFSEILEHKSILFLGNGSEKLKPLVSHNENATFYECEIDARNMCSLSDAYFQKKEFFDIAYSEPNYVKDVYFNTTSV